MHVHAIRREALWMLGDLKHLCCCWFLESGPSQVSDIRDLSPVEGQLLQISSVRQSFEQADTVFSVDTRDGHRVRSSSN